MRSGTNLPRPLLLVLVVEWERVNGIIIWPLLLFKIRVLASARHIIHCQFAALNISQ